jgi:Rieske Fe-S protein
MSVQPLTRRSMLTGAVVSAAAAVVGFVVARNSSAASAKSPTSGANGYGGGGGGNSALVAAAKVTPAGIVEKGLVLTRDASGAVHAVSATCTHQGCTVAAPHDGIVSCPCHGSQFDAVTGRVLRGPATRPLPAVAVHLQGDQIVRG